MQKYIYPACFLATAPLIAQGIAQEVHQDIDYIVLQDGSKISGTLTHIPPISFQFGNVPLKMSEVASIAFSYQGTARKMEVITHEGFRYIANAPKDNFVILRYIPSQANAKYTIQKEVNPSIISYIALKPRGFTSTKLSRKSYEVELKNGDRIPVIFGRKPLVLSTGLQDGVIATDEIVKLTVDNGIYGTLKNKQGKESEFDYAFSKDKILNVQVVNSHEMLGLAWDQISKIRTTESVNDSFVLKVPDFKEESQEVAFNEVKRVKPVNNERFTQLNEEKKQLEQQIEELKADNFRLAQYSKAIEEKSLIAELEREISTPINAEFEAQFFAESLSQKDKKIGELEAIALEETLTYKDNLQRECDRSSELEVFLKDAIEETKVYEERISSLSTELQNTETSAVESKKKISELEVEIEKVRNQYLISADSTESYEKMIVELQEKLLIEKQHVQNVEEILSLFAGETAIYQAQIIELKEVLNAKDVTIKNIQANHEVKDYQKKVAALEDQLAFLTAHEENQVNEKKKFIEEKALRRSLEKNLSRMAFQIEEYEEQITALQVSQDGSQHQLEVALKDLEEKVQKKSSQVEEDEKTIAKLQQQLHKKSVELADLTHMQTDVLDLMEEDTASWAIERESLKGQLEESALNIAQLEESVSNAKNELIHKSEEFVALKESNEKLRNLINESQNIWEGEKQTLASHLKEKSVNIEDFELAIAATQKELNNKIEELETLAETNATLQNIMDESQAIWNHEKSELTQKIEASISNIADLEIKIATTQENLNNKNLELNLLLEENALSAKGYEEENDQNNDALIYAEEKISELITANTQIQNQIQALQNERESFEERLSEERIKTQVKDQEVQSLNQSLKIQRKALARIEQAHSDLHAKLAEQKSSHTPSISLIAENKIQATQLRNGFTPFRKVHSVSEGENLRTISTKYYGNPNRWSDIYEANRDVIRDVDHINVGITLAIP